MKISAQIGEVEITDAMGRVTRTPCYTCGHCSSVIMLRPDRPRPRKTCLQCGRWICEKNEICNTHCTPLHSLAKDHFENAGEFGKYVPAIMQGVTKVGEAERLGLIAP